jgi:EAL domain-containing protein (putative c-di-GMP-specific phosphodiesterase class I)
MTFRRPHVQLQITQSALCAADIDILERLNAAGVSLAIDDYGKGYSSLFVLRDSPAGSVKIDREFVNRAEQRAADNAIVKHTIRLAMRLAGPSSPRASKPRSNWP